MGNPTKVKHGPGKLYFGTVGADETGLNLTAIKTAPPAAFIEAGYTKDGSTATLNPKYDPVEVAEELDPIDYAPSQRTITIDFTCAEITAQNISKAMNGGTITTSTGEVTFEPPASGAAPTYVSILWISDLKDEMWLYRRCLQTGDSKMDRKKGADPTGIPVSYQVLTVAGKAPFKSWFAAGE